MPQAEATLPQLDSEYSLPSDSVSSFQENGHIYLPGVASKEEVSAYAEAIRDTALSHSKEDRKLEDRDTYGKAFLQIGNVWEKSEAVKKFIFAKRFAKIAADLLGADGVRMYHDQALFKEAGGGHTPWHQDQYYWPIDSDKTITMWMPLVDATPEMGVMEFASGSHKDGFIGHIKISDESEDYFNNYVKDKEFPIETNAMDAGDATFHYGWTLHKAPPNKSDQSREVITIIYFADGVKIKEPDNQNRINDLKHWFPGQKPGEIAASPKNPLLYSRK